MASFPLRPLSFTSLPIFPVIPIMWSILNTGRHNSWVLSGCGD
jgi:hypothetical protein